MTFLLNNVSAGATSNLWSSDGINENNAVSIIFLTITFYIGIVHSGEIIGLMTVL